MRGSDNTRVWRGVLEDGCGNGEKGVFIPGRGVKGVRPGIGGWNGLAPGATESGVYGGSIELVG